MRNFILKVGIVLLTLAMACLYVGLTRGSKIRPASDYEDKGVYTYLPYQTFPTQVKNTATGRQGRLHPTKTVYLVYYKAKDAAGYEWKDQVENRSTAENIVAAGEPVERRILSIKENGKYITIEGHLTAESYVFGQCRLYWMMAGFSAVYLVSYLAAWVIILKKRNKETVKQYN